MTSEKERKEQPGNFHLSKSMICGELLVQHGYMPSKRIKNLRSSKGLKRALKIKQIFELAAKRGCAKLRTKELSQRASRSSLKGAENRRW
jgi:hypothetical protein